MRCFFPLIIVGWLWLSHTPSIFAQTEPAPDLASSVESATPAPSSFVAQTNWPLALPAKLANETLAPSAILSVKPPPLTLAALAQGNGPYSFGLEFSLGGIRPGSWPCSCSRCRPYRSPCRWW